MLLSVPPYGGDPQRSDGEALVAPSDTTIDSTRTVITLS